MYIITYKYTYKYIKYIKPLYKELQETITVNNLKICTFTKKYTVQDKKRKGNISMNETCK